MRSRRTAYRIATLRRLVAAALAGFAVLTVVRILAPPPAGLVSVVAVAHDLPAGAVLGSQDLLLVQRDPEEIPTQAVTDPASAAGEALAGPVAAGEVLTSVRLHGRSLLAGQPDGTVAVGVPLGDESLVGDVAPGDEVTIHAAGTGSSLATGTVLAVRTPDPSALGGQSGGASVVVAVSESDAGALAAALGGPSAGFVLALHR